MGKEWRSSRSFCILKHVRAINGSWDFCKTILEIESWSFDILDFEQTKLNNSYMKTVFGKEKGEKMGRTLDTQNCVSAPFLVSQICESAPFCGTQMWVVPRNGLTTQIWVPRNGADTQIWKTRNGADILFWLTRVGLNTWIWETTITINFQFPPFFPLSLSQNQF